MNQTVASHSHNRAEGVWFISPDLLLRIGGCPMNVVDSLRFELTARWAQEVLDLEDRLRERQDSLLDALHKAVREQASDQAVQRMLISLKRDVYNMRVPKDLDKAVAAGSRLDEYAGAASLQEWLSDVQLRAELRGSGEMLLEEEAEQKRLCLKSALQDPSFRSGILAASPSLEKDMDHYMSGPNRSLNRRLRLLERGLLLYILRAACKTSPFSTLTVVAPGRFEESFTKASTGITYHVSSMDKRSVVQINIALLSRISALVQSCEQIQPDLPIRIKSGWEVHENRIRYLRRMLTPASEPGPQVLDSVKESVFYLPLSPTLRSLISIIGDGREIKFIDLVKEVSDEREGQRVTVEEFMRHLLRLDLLEVGGLRPSMASPTPLRDYWERLAQLENPITAEVSARLEKVDRLVESYPESGANDRRRITNEVSQEIEACFSILGGSTEETPRTLIYEDATIDVQHVVMDSGFWKERLDGLADIQRLLPIFDLTTGPRLVMKGFFKVFYGEGQRCDDLLSFAEVFTRDYYDQYRRALMTNPRLDDNERFAPSINHFGLLDISQLDEARQSLADYLNSEMSGRAAGCKEIMLSGDALKEIGSRVPDRVSRLYSNSFFSQVADTSDGPMLVINRVYSGLSQMFSRFIQLVGGRRGDLVESLRSTLDRIQPEGAVFAEIQGAYDTNLNLHSPVARYEIVCPGEESVLPRDRQITINDLYVEHDTESDSLRLRSTRLGREVIPLYLGFLVHMALPQLQQVLVNFSSPSFGMLDLWTGVKAPEAVDGVTFYPRLRYGDIVLQRAMWRVESESLPRRAPSQSDAEYFLAVLRWRRDRGIPVRVFIAPGFGAIRTEQPEAPQRNAAPEREAAVDRLISKPLYVDFENYFTIQLLERAISRARGQLIVTEMLPGREQQVFHYDNASYVTEFIIETYGSR